MEQGIKEKIERLKVKAELFLDKDIRVFVKTVQNDYYFCDILSVGDIHLAIQSFAGKREGQKDYLVWTDISEIYEYREEGE
jgi:hypothetical protein